MNVTQASEIVNEVVSQALGETALSVYSAQGIVSLGNLVLSSTQNTEAFTNTLVQRIGRTIISFRAYRNKLSDMVMDDFQFGAIVQKIKINMPEATEDKVWDLPADGQSVDQYIISRPQMTQKFFVTRAPYSFFVTIQEDTLEEAFLSETAMGAFIGAIYGEVQNKLEVSLEALGRLTVANFIAEVSKVKNGNQVINLVTDFNAFHTEQVTSENALTNSEFLRYAVKRIRNIMRMMTEMSTIFNSENVERHTPLEYQRVRLNMDFVSSLETVVEWAAFNDEYVKLAGFTDIAYWQSIDSPNDINLIPASATDNTAVQVKNIIGVIHDRDALGTYKKEDKVRTTPVNARALYYNTFWHEKQLWFNDLSENFVVFTLN